MKNHNLPIVYSLVLLSFASWVISMPRSSNYRRVEHEAGTSYAGSELRLMVATTHMFMK